MMAGALLLTGIFAGLLAGLLGVGGGIVIVPVLFILFSYMGVPTEFIMHMAVATSLMTIIPISLLSARSHHRRGAVDFVILRQWGPFMLAGAAVGGGLYTYSGVISQINRVSLTQWIFRRSFIAAETAVFNDDTSTSSQNCSVFGGQNKDKLTIQI